MIPLPDIHPPLINASGILSYPEVFLAFERSGAALGGYVTKSVGPVEKAGNENPVVVYPEDHGGPVLNSLALPTQNPEDWIQDISETRFERSKLIISVYGGTPEEFASVVGKMSPFTDAIELNLGCPNKVPGEETIMESIGQHPSLAGEVVRLSRSETDKALIAKLSPNSDYMAVAEACIEEGADAFGCANTLGPGLAIDIRTRNAILTGTTGGISGPALKPISLRMTHDVYARYKCPIVAYGGISTWRDALEYFLAGACILGIGTAFLGKSTAEASALTRNIWEGILAYLEGESLTSLVGGAHRLPALDVPHA